MLYYVINHVYGVYLYQISQLAKVVFAIARVASVGLGVGGCPVGQLWPNYSFWVRRGSVRNVNTYKT